VSEAAEESFDAARAERSLTLPSVDTRGTARHGKPSGT
jgi:hypothetical protein